MELQEALESLDLSNDNHWTQDGLPRLETLRMLVSNSSLSRDDVSSQFPNFKRESTATTFPKEAIVGETFEVTENTNDEEIIGSPETITNTQASEELNDDSEELFLSEQIALAEQKLAEAQSRLIELRLQQDLLIEEQPPENSQMVIQKYLAQSKSVLQERGNKIKLIADSGIDLKQLASDLKSPLDASFSKRRK